MIDDDDLTIDGTDLLQQLRQGPVASTDESTLTERPPMAARWTPSVAALPLETATARPSGISRLQMLVVVCTFVVGAVLGLVIGMQRSGGEPIDPAAEGVAGE